MIERQPRTTDRVAGAGSLSGQRRQLVTADRQVLVDLLDLCFAVRQRRRRLIDLQLGAQPGLAATAGDIEQLLLAFEIGDQHVTKRVLHR